VDVAAKADGVEETCGFLEHAAVSDAPRSRSMQILWPVDMASSVGAPTGLVKARLHTSMHALAAHMKTQPATPNFSKFSIHFIACKSFDSASTLENNLDLRGRCSDMFQPEA
jgi:hypothetical protein